MEGIFVERRFGLVGDIFNFVFLILGIVGVVDIVMSI